MFIGVDMFVICYQGLKADDKIEFFNVWKYTCIVNYRKVFIKL